MSFDHQSSINNHQLAVMSPHPSYLRVFRTFARNSLVRDMTFPANFIIETISSMAWVMMNLGLYLLIFHYTPHLGAKDDPAAAWDKYQFFVFLATSLFINSLVQTFFMPNAEEFSELIRTGRLDFALLKPIDTQFLISLQKVDWSSLANLAFALVLLGYAVPRLDGFTPSIAAVLLYPLYIVCGAPIMYSLMITLAATSVWLGRNQSLYDFWFYITNFSRYPMEIYQRPDRRAAPLVADVLLPVLVVVNVPARMMAKPLRADYAYLAVFAVARHGDLRRRQSLDLHPRAGQLSQREQLEILDVGKLAYTRRLRLATSNRPLPAIAMQRDRCWLGHVAERHERRIAGARRNKRAVGCAVRQIAEHLAVGCVQVQAAYVEIAVRAECDVVWLKVDRGVRNERAIGRSGGRVSTDRRAAAIARVEHVQFAVGPEGQSARDREPAGLSRERTL